MKISRFVSQVLFVAVSLFAISRADAQNPTISLFSGLSFGSIQGTTTISYSASGAAHFEIQFANYVNATASVTFILPSSLSDGSGDNLPITFATNSGYYNVGSDNAGYGGNQFNPNTGIINAGVNAGVHTDYFFIGGTVTPGNNFVAATYTGTMTMTISVVVSGQTYTASQDIGITATLLGRVSLTATGALDFGQVLAGTTPPALSPHASGAPEITATSTTGSHTYTVTFSASQLNDGYGHTLNFTPSLTASATNNQTGSTTISSPASVNLGRRGSYYFWVGGSLAAVPAGQTPGNYSGTFVLTMAY